MILIGVALLVLAIGILGAMLAMRGRTRAAPPLVARDLASRIASARDAVGAAEPWRPSTGTDVPDGAATIEAALIAGDVRRALETAEAALTAAPDAGPPRVWLAWALCANGQPAAALEQLGQAKQRGGASGIGTDLGAAPAGSSGSAEPLAAYVRARAEHLAFEHGTGAIGALPPLVTTADLAIVTLARGRGGAAWLTGGKETQLSSDTVLAAVGEHREITARCLGLALDALALAPGFADAGYLVARLAIKAGALVEGSAMFETMAARMAGRPDPEAFARDRQDLADPSGAVAAAKRPAVRQVAKRSRSLRVL